MGKKTSDNLAKLLDFVIAGKDWCVGSKASNAISQHWSKKTETDLPFIAETILQSDRCAQEQEFYHSFQVGKWFRKCFLGRYLSMLASCWICLYVIHVHRHVHTHTHTQSHMRIRTFTGSDTQAHAPNSTKLSTHNGLSLAASHP